MSSLQFNVSFFKLTGRKTKSRLYDILSVIILHTDSSQSFLAFRSWNDRVTVISTTVIRSLKPPILSIWKDYAVSFLKGLGHQIGLAIVEMYGYINKGCGWVWIFSVETNIFLSVKANAIWLYYFSGLFPNNNKWSIIDL